MQIDEVFEIDVVKKKFRGRGGGLESAPLPPITNTVSILSIPNFNLNEKIEKELPSKGLVCHLVTQ